MLSRRLFFGALLIAVLLGLIYADDWLSIAIADRIPEALTSVGVHTCNGPVITLVIIGLVVLGTWELRRLFVTAGHTPLLGWAVVVNVGLVLIPFYAGNAMATDAVERRATDYQYTVIWLTIALLGTGLLIARRRKTDRAVGDIATTLFIVFYLGLLPQYIVRLRLVESSGAVWLLLYFVGTVKICDIGAYFTGIAIGKHKLIEWLSPHKTLEGLAGGVAASILVAALVPLLIRRFGSAASGLPELFPGLAGACVFGLFMALTGQAGDLLESLMKRDAQAKDSASAIPAFGGVLDILDSPLLAAPIAYWMLARQSG